MRQNLCGLAVALVASALWAAPAFADGGGTYVAKFMPTPPTIDGTLSTFEWDAASSFSVTFGTQYPGTVYVGRDATYLYVAIQVHDDAAGGDTGVWFDNADNGTVDVGDDLMNYNQADVANGVSDHGTDWFTVSPVNIATQNDTFAGGTNDVFAKWGSSGGVQTFEYRKPLCSADSAHDFCFTHGKLGIAYFYRNAAGQSQGFGSESIGDQSTFTEAQFAPGPPTVTLTSGETGQPAESLQLLGNGAYQVWFRGGSAGSFTLSVPQSDSGSSIASANWPSTVYDAINTTQPAAGWSATAGQTPRDAVYTFTSSAADTTSFQLTATDTNGQTSQPRTVAFTHDGVPPSVGIDCQPIGCNNNAGPVRVTLLGGVDRQSGLQAFRYTLDSSASQPTWVDAAPGSTISVTHAAPKFQLQAIDNVGNTSTATASITGAPQPQGLTWDYANDFQLRSNPGPDLYGNTSVWSYGEVPVASQHNASTSTLYTTTAVGPQDCWISSSPDQGNVPDDCVVPGTSPPDPDVDPGATRDTFITWTSPVSGFVSIKGGFRDADAQCGDGIDWFIDQNGTTLASDSFANGGSSTFNGLNAVAVSSGDKLTFLVGPGAGTDAACDSTAANITIKQIQPTTTTTSTPSAPQVTIDNPLTDHATVAPNGIPGLPQGTVTFYVCGPLASAAGCSAGGTQVGSAKTLPGDGGGVDSDPFAPTAAGYWCFRAEYSGDKTFPGSQDGSAGECVQATATAQAGPTFTVNTSDDPGAGGCYVEVCSLRDAITAANKFDGAATIQFALTTPNPVIAPLTALPAVQNAVTIQGSSTGAPGVTIDGSEIDGRTDGLTIGGQGAKVIGLAVVGFGFDAIRASGAGVDIENNQIGVSPAPSASVGNGQDGIEISGGGSTVRGNVVEANNGNGILLLAANGTTVSGNFVGTDAAQSGLRGNTSNGIAVAGGTKNVLTGNVVVASGGDGILLTAHGELSQPTVGAVVLGNTVGGTGEGQGNGGDGIHVWAVGSSIGGTGRSQPNQISGNEGAGVSVVNAASTGNSIRGNSISSNGGLGIDLGGDGLTPNDTGDSDAGPNHLVNFPILAPLATGTTVAVNGKLVAAPDTRYTVDAYTNTACDPSGFGEGKTWVGTVDVTTDATGVAGIPLTFDDGGTLPTGVTLTATDAGLRETSEFSQCQTVTVSGNTTGATLNFNGNAPTSPAGASIVTLANIPRDAFSSPSLTSAPIDSSPIDSSPIDSSPIDSSPIDSSPIDSSPIDSSPIDSSPIDSSGLTPSNLQQSGLGGVPLSELPLFPPKTWAGVLGSDVPEQSTTLADALTLKPDLGGLTIGDIDWAHSTSALASVGIGVFALGNAPLDHIQPLAAWCDAINGCTDPASLGGKTVMDIALEGIPIDSSGFGTAPIDSSDLTGTPIDSSPIDSSAIAGTPIDSSPLDAVDMTVSVLGTIPISAVIAAGSPLGGIPGTRLPATLCSPCGATLAASTLPAGAVVGDLGPALHGFTIGDLKTYPGVTFGNIGPGLPPTITIRDLLRAYFSRVPLDPSTLPLDGIQLVADDPNGRNTVTYTASIALQGTGTGVGYAELHVAIDPSARYVPGSTTFDGAAGNDPGVENGQLAWALNGLQYGRTYTLSFKVFAGLRLGLDRASATLLPAGAPAVNASPVDVGVTDTFEGGGGNNTPATATPIQPGKLYLSFEQTQADTDYYTLPVPPTGTVTTITLSHLANDKDLVVLAPNGLLLRSSPIDSSPIDSSPIDSSPVLDPLPTITQSSDPLQPAAVQDVPIDSSQLGSNVVAGVSDNAGTSDDSVTVVSNGGSGNYLIHVVNSDATPTTTPYTLDVHETPPTPPAPCPAGPRVLPLSGQGTAQPTVDPTSSPNATTLILADFKRYGDTYGSGPESNLVTKLNTLASTTGGLVVPVEGVQAVRDAYTNWDAHTCDPEAANGVVRAIISNIVDPFHVAHPSAKFLVLTGSDAIIPFPRVPDATTTSNERNYVGTIGHPKDALGNVLPPVNNELVGTAVASYMETDDVWSAFNPMPFLSAPLYLPQWATGRLVETPPQIEHQLDVFNAPGGNVLSPTTAFTAGYSFLKDSAQAVQGALGSIATSSNGLLVDPPDWSRTDLLNNLQLGSTSGSPQINTINAHYDHYRALPADHGTLFTTGDVSHVSNAEIGRLIFSVGCHSGFSVPDELYAASAGPFALDWPEVDFASGAVARVANTTYGYGDTDTIGYSEQVEVDFAKRLGQMTLGEALLYAKQQYAADLGTVGPFEQKSLNALTFYGLPMQRIGSGSTPTPPTPPTTVTDTATGLQSYPVTSSVTFGQPTTAPSGGSYFSGPDGIDATNNRPFEPKAIIRNITVPGLVPHGFVITGLGVDPSISPFIAARSRAIPDAPGLTPTLASRVGWPSGLARISSFASPTGPQQQLVLLHGQFLSDPKATDGSGTQTNFNKITGSVLYSTSHDALPPQLSNIRVTAVPTGVAFEVDATDATSVSDTQNSGTVKEIVVVYYEPATSGITAHVIMLSQTPGTNHWSGGGPLVGSVSSINYMVQGVDAAGNVGLSVHKVVTAPIVLQQGGGDAHVAMSPGGPPAGGWFGSAQSVSISADSGYVLSYSVDGGAVHAYSGTPFTVTGDGVHVIDAFADDGAGHQSHATAVIPIDTVGPVITINSPVSSSYLLNGDVVKASYYCTDTGSGLATTGGCVGPVPNGSPIGSAAGDKTFTVTAQDAVGHTSSKSVTYQVWPWSGFLAPVDNAPIVNVATAGSAIPVKFSLGGNRGLAFATFVSQKVNCNSAAPLDAIEQTVTAGSSSLQYDSTSNQYSYVWKTDKTWSGTCRDFTIQFTNGDTELAHFKFK